MEKAKITMLARVLGIFVFGFLIGITISANAQEITELLVDEGKTTINTEKYVPDWNPKIPETIEQPVLDIEKTPQELISEKIELQADIVENNLLLSKYAQALDTCRATGGR